jgi:DNA polymerase-1
VPPERIVDYLSLIGDAVDNVPGVPKVGPKTAVKWLTEYGTLDDIMGNAEKIKGVVGENLRNTLDWLPRARELVTVKTDCDLSGAVADFQALHDLGEDKEKLIAFFQRYGFKTWLREATGERCRTHARQRARAEARAGAGRLFDAPAPADAPAEDVPPAEISYETVTTEAALDAWLRKIADAPIVAVDTETTSLDPMLAQLVGISLSVEPGAAAYIPWRIAAPTSRAREPWPARASTCSSAARVARGSDASEARPAPEVRLARVRQPRRALRGIAHDTMLESYVLASHRNHGMDSLAERLLSLKTITYEEVCGKGANQIGFDQIDLPRATEYAAEDADVTLRLHRKMLPQLEASEGLKYVYERSRSRSRWCCRRSSATAC